jgi:alkanesulfonate monooxygenase SsuD/methylene tetrahydromethanopterin reductase-like flavin-dependent oxidoreductase (luciferase family)
VRVDIMLLQNEPWPILRERAARAEAMGFTGLWMADHFVNPYVQDQDWFESWTLLGAIAEATRTIRFGPMVSSLTLRNPALLARAAMTLDHISGGRFDLGMGAGGAPLDHSMTGVPTFTPAERVGRFRESVQIVSDLLTTGAASAPSGGYYHVDSAQVHPSPVQQPLPLTVAALGKGALRVAARYATTWNTMGMARGRDLKGLLPHEEAMAITRERSATLDRFLEEEGKDPTAIRRSYLVAGTYSGATPSVEEFLRVSEDLQDIGMDGMVIYWPSDPANEPALERLAVEALPRLAD